MATEATIEVRFRGRRTAMLLLYESQAVNSLRDYLRKHWKAIVCAFAQDGVPEVEVSFSFYGSCTPSKNFDLSMKLCLEDGGATLIRFQKMMQNAMAGKDPLDALNDLPLN